MTVSSVLIAAIIAILTATTVLFAVLLFMDYSDAAKYEQKAESLAAELSDLKCDMSSMKARTEDK